MKRLTYEICRNLCCNFTNLNKQIDIQIIVFLHIHFTKDTLYLINIYKKLKNIKKEIFTLSLLEKKRINPLLTLYLSYTFFRT